MRSLTTPSRSTHASFWRRPIEPAGTGVLHCSICALHKMHPIKEEREERVKNQAQRRPATGRLLCLIFLDRAAGGEKSGRSSPKRGSKAAADADRFPGGKRCAESLCREKANKIFGGEFQGNSKTPPKKRQKNRPQKPKL